MAKTDQMPLLEVRNLKTYFYTEDGIVSAMDGISFDMYPGEVVGSLLDGKVGL